MTTDELQREIVQLRAEVSALHERVNELTTAPRWPEFYKLPDDAIPPRAPSPEQGMVLQMPFVVEDPKITDDDLRALQALRADVGQWREGPAASGWRYWGGNYKLWAPNGLMLTAISDTVDIMCAILPVDPVTGELMPYPTKGTLHGRMYDSFWKKTDRGWVISARTAEVQVLKNAVRIEVTDNEDVHPPEPIVQFNAPEDLNSGRTGWHLGVVEPSGEYGYRMVHLVRLSSVVDAEALRPEFAGMYVMYVDPNE